MWPLELVYALDLFLELVRVALFFARLLLAFARFLLVAPLALPSFALAWLAWLAQPARLVLLFATYCGSPGPGR